MGQYQTGRNVTVAYKARGGGNYGDAATGGGGATVFRPISGGLKGGKGTIASNENRRDGMKTRPRHGMHNVSGSYAAELNIGGFDDLFAAAFRSSWNAATTITQATGAMATATLSCSASVITASAGNFITAGLRVGDVFVMGGGLTGNVNKNLRAVAVTATTVTVAEPLSVVAGPVATWSMAIKRKLIQGGPMVETDFTFEEYEADIDASEQFDGCRIGGFSLELTPENLVKVTFNITGQKFTPLTGAAAPYFSNPTSSITLPLSVADASIRLGTENLLDLTGFNLNFNTNPSAVPVIASKYTPDVFLNLADVTGSISGLRKDLSRVSNMLNEDQLSLHLLCCENESEPKDFFSLSITNMTLGGVDKSDLGSDGPRTQQLPLLIGVDEAGGAFDNTMVKLVRSNA